MSRSYRISLRLKKSIGILCRSYSGNENTKIRIRRETQSYHVILGQYHCSKSNLMYRIIFCK